jgi:hypothetical protein|eukprot:CAMPEP_0185599736 /NCGR_PEP_ID=MMETSP0434-20130131/82905_1 /TAXON_ID=626734 ORGANISM="Favella taraikaensis, Strain Fe Narragansett Bay" /NCGR_SAMPLE_ID=MMETSP0434 /ASSEMBLY_ACC=CAM_ASM_000379 /LENGTH=76 /DNA_ID=CAMNT_0028229237 /DNA_START=124 /DNA_END=354 /DNA_ORIENTATION=-
MEPSQANLHSGRAGPLVQQDCLDEESMTPLTSALNIHTMNQINPVVSARNKQITFDFNQQKTTRSIPKPAESEISH